MEIGRAVVPIEVKSGKVGRMQSLELYTDRYHPKAVFVISHNNNRIGDGGSYTMVPLYMAWRFDRYAEVVGLKKTPSELPPLPQWTPPGDRSPRRVR